MNTQVNVNRVAFIGECMVELQKSGDLYKQSFGGDTLNTALYFSRLTRDHQISSSYITGLGKDTFSQGMLTAWQNEKIDTQFVHISPKKLVGLYAIETRADGERSFHYWRSDSAAKYWLRERPVDAVLQDLKQHQVIYLSGISLAILPQDCREILFTLLELCKKEGITIAFDNNFRPALWESLEEARSCYARMLAVTDMAFLTFDDEQLLYGDTNEEQAIKRTQAFGVTEIVVKRGGDACYVVTADGRIEVAANKIDHIVDTTAAGDSFSAGYLAKRVLGGTPQQAAIAGHAVAGKVIQYAGAIIANEFMPTI